MTIAKYIKNHKLKPVTKEQFYEFYIHIYEDVSARFSYREGVFYYNPDTLDHWFIVNDLYQIVDLSGAKTNLEKDKLMSKERALADDVRVVAEDEDGNVLIHYVWNLWTTSG